MKIAIDLTPTIDKNHKFRGSGFYIHHLKESLVEQDNKNEYIFYTIDNGIPKDADIVHIPYFEPFFLTLPIATPKRTVVTVHDLIPLIFPDKFPSGIKGKLKWQIQKRNLRIVDAVITDSESSKNDILRLTGLSNRRVYVVPLAAAKQFKKLNFSEKNAELNVFEIKKKYNLPEKFALYVGDVTWNKNVPNIIEACLQIKVPLLLVGKALADTEFDRSNPWNSDRVRIEQMVRNNNLVGRVGFVPSKDLVVLYNLATVFVMPSYYEGFGLPILEAMQCGCPVVTSKEGSILEVVGDAGYYADPSKSESIAHAINSVFTDKDLQEKLAIKSLAQSEKFSWEETARKTIEVYERFFAKF